MTHDDRFSEWDAAYVLGALSSGERREYEQHLESCAACAQSVASLAAMPGLLAVLPSEEAFALLDTAQRDEIPVQHATAEAEILPFLVKKVRRQRRQRFTLTLVSGFAAAAVVAAIVVVPQFSSAPAPSQAAALQQVVPSSLSATVALTAKKWGTSIDMSCHYAGQAAGSGSTGTAWHYGLYVTDTSGTTTRVSSWTASPGTTAKTTGSIATALRDITRVEVRNEASGAVLLTRTIS